MPLPLWRSRPTAFEMLPATSVRNGPINDFIYLSEGNSNAYQVVTDEGRVVINTGMGFEAPVHKAVFDAIDSGPIRYILLTQGHVDHVGGVDFFREEGTLLIAQANNPAQQADDARIGAFRARRSAFAFAEAIAKANEYVKKHHGSAISPQSQPKPDILVDENYAFELGGLRFELIAVPGAETTDSLLIWLPQHGICFTGNVFGALFGHFPNLVTMRGDRYRDALKYVDTLETVMALEAEMLLVGHHGPVVGRETIRAELERTRDAVLHVHDATIQAMNERKDVWTAMREVSLPAELEVGQGYGKVSWSVRAIWENYSGWFHQRSTTELYATPPSSVHAQLVELAGGPDAVAGAAHGRVEAGMPVQAIHLAEIALSADPEHRLAAEASVSAHRALLAQSENFWETAWLRKEIRRLEKRLSDSS
ncbi:MAG: MBL fold metallo-hydrolase [bacterium]|nr:MBL fold metallo-hydrolase [bacterium]